MTDSAWQLVSVLIPGVLLFVVAPLLIWVLTKLFKMNLSIRRMIALVTGFIGSVAFFWIMYSLFVSLAFTGLIIQVLLVKWLARQSFAYSLMFSILFDIAFGAVSTVIVLLPIYAHLSSL